MSAPKQIVVTQADVDFVDEVTSAANLVTYDGYFEINTDAIILDAARFRIAATRSAEARIAGLVEALEPWLRHHADCEKCQGFSVFSRPKPCSCGLSAALATTNATTEGEKG